MESKNGGDTMEEMKLKEKLLHIQIEMKVPKNMYNSFNNFYYRNAETILDTAKPLCEKYRCLLTIGDDVVLIGERYYVVAVAKLEDLDSDDVITNSAKAREQFTKKGMDESQLTGATSSYARKYALNGLFNLDDVKDNDDPKVLMQDPESDDEPKEPKAAKPKEQDESKLPRISEKQKALINKLYTKEEIMDMEQRKGEMDNWSIKLASDAIEKRSAKK